MWWNGRFAWMCSWQICSNYVMLSCQYGPKSLRNVSNTLLNLCHEEFRHFWRQKGVQPGTNNVYIIKWPVSVYIYIYSLLFIFLTDSFLNLRSKHRLSKSMNTRAYKIHDHIRAITNVWDEIRKREETHWQLKCNFKSKMHILTQAWFEEKEYNDGSFQSLYKIQSITMHIILNKVTGFWLTCNVIFVASETLI